MFASPGWIARAHFWMLKIINQIVGWIFLGSGLILFPLPIPLGAPFVVIGSFLLMGSSERFAGFLMDTRRKFPKFNAIFDQVTRKMPGPVRKTLSRTDPNNSENHDIHP